MVFHIKGAEIDHYNPIYRMLYQHCWWMFFEFLRKFNQERVVRSSGCCGGIRIISITELIIYK